MCSSERRLFELSELRDTVHYGLVSIREDEFEAVISRLGARIGEARGRRVYNVYEVKTTGGAVARVVACRSIAPGNGLAQAVAADIADEIRPAWMLVCGIGGAVPSDEYSLGDVVISSRIDDLRVGAALPNGKHETAPAGGPLHRDARAFAENIVAIKPELGPWNSVEAIGQARPTLLLDSDLFLGDADWNKKTRRGLEEFLRASRQPIVTVRVVAATDLNMKDPELVKAILGPFRDVGLFEMESAGMHQIAHDRDIPFLSVRGVSDIVGFKKGPEWVSYACHTAASFLKALVTYDPLPKLPGQGPGNGASHGGGSRSAAESLLLRSITKLGQSRSGTGIAGSVEVEGRIITIDTTPPPIERGTANRSLTVGPIARDLKAGGWTHLVGLSGFGKTVLARLVLEARPDFDLLWLRLRELDEKESTAVLDALCGASRVTYDTFKKSLRRPVLLTIDDMPSIARQSALSERLLWLLSDEPALALLSTSVHRIPEWLIRAFPAESVRVISLGGMSYEEFTDALRARGSPEEVLKDDRMLRLLFGLVEGVPVLVSALSSYLEAQSWVIDQSSIHAIFRGAYKEDVEKEVLGRLVESLPDRGATRLLYRLSLDRGPWQTRQITSVAHVDPALDRVKERLGLLDGLWMQRDGPDKRMPSPLVLDLGKSELPVDELAACHKAIGRALLHGRVDQMTLLRAIRHSVQGRDQEQATIALLSGLQAFLSTEDNVPDLGLLDISIERVAGDAPAAMQAVLYALQAAGKSKVGREAAEIAKSFARFQHAALQVQRPEPDEASSLVSAVFVLSLRAELEFKKWSHLLLPIVADWMSEGENSLAAQFDTILTWFGSEVWLSGVRDPTEDGLSRWMDFLDRLPDALVRRIARQELAGYAAPIIAEILVNATGSVSDPDLWRKQVAKLESFINWSRQHGLTWLAAWSTRSVQMVFVEKIRALDEALKWTASRSNVDQDDPVVRFVTNELPGVALAVAGQFETAEDWLDTALSGGPTPYGNRQVIALVWSAVAAHGLGRDPARVVEMIQRAIAIADTAEGVDELDSVKTRAEYAQFLFLQGDVAGSLQAFDDAYRVLLQKDRTDEWKDTFVLFQVVVLNLTAVALSRESKRQMPVEVHNLRPGMFFTTNRNRRDGFKQENVFSTGFLLADAAFTLGEDAISEASLRRLLVTTEAARDRQAVGHLRVRLGLHNLVQGSLADAIRLACAGINSMRPDRMNGSVFTSSPDGREVRLLTIAILVPAILQCAAIGGTSTSEGEAGLKALRAGLRHASETLDTAWRPALEEMHQLLDLVEQGPATSNTLFRLAAADAKQGGSIWMVIAAARTLWFHEIRLKDAAAAHIQIFQAAVESMVGLPGIITRMVAPSVFAYWRQQFSARRMEFPRPNILDGSLEIQPAKPAASELERLLRDLMFALEIPSPPGGQWPAWGS